VLLKRSWTNGAAVPAYSRTSSAKLSKRVLCRAVSFLAKSLRAAAKAGLRALFTSEPTAGTYSVNGCAVLGRFTLQQGASAQTCRGTRSRTACSLPSTIPLLERKENPQDSRRRRLAETSPAHPSRKNGVVTLLNLNCHVVHGP
jgi:hypothetical protein